MDIAATITVYPQGRTLPEAFIQKDWGKEQDHWMLPQCLFNMSVKCSAFIVDGTSTVPQRIILANDILLYGKAALFQAAGKEWEWVGNFSGLFNCKGVHDALKVGQFSIVPASGEELDVAGMKIQVKRDDKCPK